MSDAAKPDPKATGNASKNRLTLGVALVVVVVLLLKMVVYTVKDSEAAVLLTFGKPSGEKHEPGLSFKFPWPIQEVKPFDARLRVLKTPLEEMITEDGRAILVGSFVLWRVQSAKTFQEKFKGSREAETVADAEHFLARRLRNHQTAVVSSFPFGALVSAEKTALRYAQIEQRMQDGLAADAAPNGVEVRMVGIRRLTLPTAATQAVFERMRADRTRLATTIRREGQEKADAIRRAAEEERSRLLVAAEKDARALLAQADRDASPSYRAMSSDPQLAILLKKLETLEKLLKPRPGKPGPTLVMDSSQQPFDLLRPREAPPAPAKKDEKK